MRGFEYIRSGKIDLSFRTPRTALRAAEAGTAPIEAFVYRAGAIQPLFEEPWNLDEIQRMLSKPDLGIASMKNLFVIFIRMTKSKDRELAQFGAESMIELENRIENAIDSAKKALAEEESADALFSCAKLYYDRAEISVGNPATGRFYLKEAYALLKKLESAFILKKEMLELAIRILIDLRLFAKAKKLVAACRKAHLPADSPGEAGSKCFDILAAEIAFREKNIHDLAVLIGDLSPPGGVLSGKRLELVDFLSGRT